MLLTKHDGVTFQNQTVYISGQAFVGCTFIGCTLILREAVYHMDRCTFERCNWHIDRVMMWGNMDSIREIKTLVTMIESALQQHMSQMPEGAMEQLPNSPNSSGPGST
jgi:hypothetical protein